VCARFDPKPAIWSAASCAPTIPESLVVKGVGRSLSAFNRAKIDATMGIVALGIFTTSVNAGGPALEGGLLCGGPVGPRPRRLAHITEHCFNHPSVSLGFGWTDLLTWRRNENVGFGTSLATALRYGSSETGRKQTMAQDLIFWVSTASVCMGMGVLFAISVALKQLAADDDPD
jgi:hypothetical protein